MEAFIGGESNNLECPTRFHIERGRKRERGSLRECRSDEYLLYRTYWCSLGEGGTILPSRKYRLNTRNRAARPQSMRGCTCHFNIKRLYARPSLLLIIYHEKRHVNKSGFICHGPLDRDAIGPGARKMPYIGSEIQQQTMSLIYLGVPEENILQAHIEGIQRYCSKDAKVDNLASQYVQKLGMIIKRSTHELDMELRDATGGEWALKHEIGVTDVVRSTWSRGASRRSGCSGEKEGTHLTQVWLFPFSPQPPSTSVLRVTDHAHGGGVDPGHHGGGRHRHRAHNHRFGHQFLCPCMLFWLSTSMFSGSRLLRSKCFINI